MTFKNLFTVFAVLVLLTASPALAKKTDTETESVGTCDVPSNSNYWSPSYPVIQLTDDNHVVLRGPIDTSTASRVIRELHTKGSDDEVYLYINSPGGSVVDGYHIVQTIDALYHSGKTVKCVADTAISMAFVIFQSCPVRYARPSSILMQHQMSFGVGGPIEHVRNYVEFVEGMENDMLLRQAARVGLTPEEFKAKTLSDWWTYGSEITANNLADEMVYVLCAESEFNRTTKVVYRTFFGDVTVHFSGCPLLNVPLRVEWGSSDETTTDTDEDTTTDTPDEDTQKEVEDLLMKLFDPLAMYENYARLCQLFPGLRQFN